MEKINEINSQVRENKFITLIVPFTNRKSIEKTIWQQYSFSNCKPYCKNLLRHCREIVDCACVK